MIRAVIFDLDGVIVHTDVYHFKAWKKVADKLGIPFDDKINHNLRGVSRMESLEIILCNAGIKLPEVEKKALSDEKNQYYIKYLRTMKPDHISRDVLNVLKSLRDSGYKLAIGSSSRNARMILERLGIEQQFDAISDGNNISCSKPDPEVFLKAAVYLGVNPSECVVVEDAESGIQAGRNAGMRTIAIGSAPGLEIADFWLGNNSDFTQILELVKRL